LGFVSLVFVNEILELVIDIHSDRLFGHGLAAA
jgi:hypothetical protein